MSGSHLAGAGVGALVGAILVSLGSRIGLNLTNFDSATLGMGAVAAFVGVGHALGEYGVAGVAHILWHGRAKPAPAAVIDRGIPAVVVAPVPVLPVPPAS